MLKRFRVISDIAINGLSKGEEFEAEWPDPWLTRRIDSNHIEEIVEDPDPPKKRSRNKKRIEEVLEEPGLDDQDKEPEEEEV